MLVVRLSCVMLPDRAIKNVRRSCHHLSRRRNQSFESTIRIIFLSIVLPPNLHLASIKAAAAVKVAHASNKLRRRQLRKDAVPPPPHLVSPSPFQSLLQLKRVGASPFRHHIPIFASLEYHGADRMLPAAELAVGIQMAAGFLHGRAYDPLPIIRIFFGPTCEGQRIHCYRGMKPSGEQMPAHPAIFPREHVRLFCAHETFDRGSKPRYLYAAG